MTKVPMEILRYPGPQSDHKTLVIALRGLGGSHKDFEEYGFVEALHNRYPSVDMVCPNAHFGYYRERSLLQRLNEDVIKPARSQGYENFYLLGVSLGGLGSLLTIREGIADIKSTILLAPYTGEESLHSEIEQYHQGKAAAPWTKELSEPEKSLAELWQWILEHDVLFNSGRVWLGYGDNDRLSGHDLLATLLPENRVLTIEGEHRATVFAELWRDILARNPLSTVATTQ